MGHIIEDYYEHGKPEFTLIGDFDEDRESMEMGVAAQWKWEAEMSGQLSFGQGVREDLG